MTRLPCRSVIVPVIRKRRPSPSNLGEGTKSGMQIKNVYRHLASSYPVHEFLEGINALIAEQSIVVTARVFLVHPTFFRQYQRIRTVLVKQLPAELSEILLESWILTSQGKVLQRIPGTQQEGMYYHRVVAHVVADGLSSAPRRLFGDVEEFLDNVELQLVESNS